MRAMTRFRVRVVEHLIEEASGDFTVEADTPAQAAAVLFQAHDTARDKGEDLVVLSDGQSCNIEPTDVVGTRVFCLLLDEEGDEIGGEIVPDWGTPPAQPEPEETPGLSTTGSAASIEVQP